MFNPNIFAEVKSVKKANGKDIEVKHSAFMRIDDVIDKLQNPDNVLEAIPRGLKQNVFFIIHEDENMERRSSGKGSQYADDCGVWVSRQGSTANTFFIKCENNTLKSVLCRDGQYCTKKVIKRVAVFEKFTPQPVPENIVKLHRYYCTLKRSKDYKRRISRIAGFELRLG